MATVPYNPVPDQAPRTAVPDDYMHVQATPASFGGGIARGLSEEAQGEQRFGTAAVSAAKFYGTAAADNAWNQVLDQGTKLLHGDPNKMVTLPNGQQVPDTGYFGLEKEAAMRAQPQLQKQLDDLINNARETLATPEQQLQFDQISRHQRAYWLGEIGTHADREAKSWYADVFKTSIDQDLNGYARASGADPASTLHRQNLLADMVTRAQDHAQLTGSDPKAAVEAVRQQAAIVWAKTVAATDPARAQRIINDKQIKADLGDKYGEVEDHVKGKADREIGIRGGTADFLAAVNDRPYANPSLPIYRDAAQSYPGGFSPEGLARTVQVESSGNPNAGAGTAHVGLTQFSQESWAGYGKGSRLDPQQSILAAQRYSVANAQLLRTALGRDPTDAELYLAHQQGPFGAIRLLQHPNVPAGQLVGNDAIAQNGGDPRLPARSFTSMWVGRFQGTGDDWSAKSIKADAGRTWEARYERGEINYQQFAEGMHAINTLAVTRQLTEATQDKAQKQMAAEAADEWVQQIHVPGNDSAALVAKIVLDPRLSGEWRLREDLIKIAQNESGNDVARKSLMLGVGFADAFDRMMLPPDDPNRITDMRQIYQLATDGSITGKGIAAARQMLNDLQGRGSNSPEITAALHSMLAGAKTKLTYEGEQNFPGLPPKRDIKGMEIYNNQFVPQMLQRFSTLQTEKEKWAFINDTKYIDSVIEKMRPKAQRDMASVMEGAALTGDQVDQRIPPAPQGISEQSWTGVMNVRPILKSGAPLSPGDWSDAVNYLRANPTPETIAKFDKHFLGFSGKEILERLGGAPAVPTSSRPSDTATARNQPAAAPMPQMSDVEASR